MGSQNKGRYTKQRGQINQYSVWDTNECTAALQGKRSHDRVENRHIPSKAVGLNLT